MEVLNKRTVITFVRNIHSANIRLHTLPHSLCSLAIAPYMLLVVVEVSKGAPLSIPGRWER